MNERIELALAAVTIAMPIILATLHGARAITTRLRIYALTTPQAWDDNATARVLAVLDGLDAVVDAVSLVIPGPPRRSERPTGYIRSSGELVREIDPGASPTYERVINNSPIEDLDGDAEETKR